ncbi:MBL fold metallo-hydrolase [Rufibacter sp. XAAS-G3-1]|uniref:MBL fold metallo-hydrolase n=1 Tax=Rufibacter sp. XAAS-G3-1 TaxID=2729134 RepID=UPI0015E6B536|nr:MBL fold metallo-hydrolase [Rufibacter sp. XAAS-G3-1]
MKKLLLLLFCLCTFQAWCQNLAQPDRLKTKQGDLVIQPVTHGAVVLQWNNKTVWVDPYGGAALFNGLPKPDLILITDIHGDHLDLKTLQALSISNTPVVAPQAVVNQLPEPLKSNAITLQNGGQTKQLEIDIQAVPMYNLPETADSRHPKGRGNGYVLTMGKKRIYLSGDTEDIPEMRSLKKIDVAFVCMNLPFTMDIDQAASAVLGFKPKIVYPYHYRGQNGLSDVNGFKTKVEAGNKKIEVRLRQWYPQS